MADKVQVRPYLSPTLVLLAFDWAEGAAATISSASPSGATPASAGSRKAGYPTG